MSLIVFKLILPPLLILSASLAGRRWGEAIGGWVVGLPLTSGPVSAFLAIQYGPDFAAAASNGSLVGAAGQAAFALAYASLGGRGAAVALAAGFAAYAAAAAALQALALPHWGCFVAALAALTLSARGIAHSTQPGRALAAPWWDLPARMLTATAIVIALTAAASRVGAGTAGVLASVPVFGATLALFAHRMQGAATAAQVLRGMVLALYGFAAFFFVLGVLLPIVGAPSAFLAATASAGAAQTAALHVLRGGRFALRPGRFG